MSIARKSVYEGIIKKLPLQIVGVSSTQLFLPDFAKDVAHMDQTEGISNPWDEYGDDGMYEAAWHWHCYSFSLIFYVVMLGGCC